MAKQREEDFATSILQPYVDIPESDDMHVLRGVSQLEEQEQLDIVVRQITEPFWNACIAAVNTPKRIVRVCAVGTPGIGKTTATPILIRLLLHQTKTVVYLVRTTANVSFYYEFIPSQENAGQVSVNVYPESITRSKIPSLRLNSTYYVVDPGQTKDSCNPDNNFLPKTIIVASPDDRHWGERELTKRRGSVKGQRKYFPLWSEDEILVLGRTIYPSFSEELIRERFRKAGGVPRHVFSDNEDDFNAHLKDQKDAVNLLTPSAAEDIVMQRMEHVVTFDKAQPRSALIGFALNAEDRTFDKYTAVVLSKYISELIFQGHMKFLWNEMGRLGQDGDGIFESYARQLLLQRVTLVGRPGVGKSDPFRQENTFMQKTIGGCSQISMVEDLVESATARPNIVFHSLNKQYPLIDFAYRHEEVIFAFQATIGDSHTADAKAIKELEDRVNAQGFELELFYLVPREKYVNFNTQPVKPMSTCKIWHVSITAPNEEQKTYE